MIASVPYNPLRAWTVSELLAWTDRFFRRAGFESARLDAELLLAHALECERVRLYTDYHKVVEASERALYRSFVERRGLGEPVAYITGVREFYSLKFEVNPSVLIPRPETEHLVEVVLRHLPPGGKVLDLGTGSGNIAVTVAGRSPASHVVAVDSSPDALAVARRNAERHGTTEQLEFILGDLFEPLRLLEPRPRFDALVSNPPYIPAAIHARLGTEVREFEPSLALVDRQHGRDGDGTSFHRSILREAPQFLIPGGLLAVEVGVGQADVVRGCFREAGFTSIDSVTDFGGIVRVVLGFSPGTDPDSEETTGDGSS